MTARDVILAMLAVALGGCYMQTDIDYCRGRFALAHTNADSIAVVKAWDGCASMLGAELRQRGAAR